MRWVRVSAPRREASTTSLMPWMTPPWEDLGEETPTTGDVVARENLTRSLTTRDVDASRRHQTGSTTWMHNHLSATCTPCTGTHRAGSTRLAVTTIYQHTRP